MYCTRFGAAMLLSVLLSVWPAQSQSPVQITVPSGQEISLVEQFLEPQDNGDLWFRLRFLTPQIGVKDHQMTYEKSQDDLLYLCQSVALKNLSDSGQAAQLIIITLMDRLVTFGSAEPSATQFFEVFRPENATCIWEDL